jgi:hypothetical protein
MNRFLAIAFAVLLAQAVPTLASALGDEKDATPILDRAIKALGGEEKLAKASNFSSKAKGTSLIGGIMSPIKVTTTIQGLDRIRQEHEFESDGKPLKSLAIVNGSKGWLKLGDEIMDLGDEDIADGKQGAYLLLATTTILPLKSKGFKVEALPREQVDGKPADVIKGTGPDGKSFTLYFDKETHLPIRRVATVKDQGEEYVLETTYSDFKDFDGVKRATKIESKRDGNLLGKQEITEFKILEKPDASLFERPN